MLREDVFGAPEPPEDLPALVLDDLRGHLAGPQLVQPGRRGDAVQHGEVAKVAEEALDLPAGDAVHWKGGRRACLSHKPPACKN